MEAIERFEAGDHDIESKKARENSRRFDVSIFENKMKSFIADKYKDYCKRYGI